MNQMGRCIFLSLFISASTFSNSSWACGIDLLKSIAYETETVYCVSEGNCGEAGECPGVQSKTDTIYFCQDEHANTYSYTEPGVWGACQPTSLDGPRK